MLSPRASTSTTSDSSSAPTAQHEQLGAVPRRGPTKSLAGLRLNLDQWAGWNFDGERPNSGFNVNAHRCSTISRDRDGREPIRQPFDDRATRGGPGAFSSAQRSIWGVIEGDDARRSRQHLQLCRRGRQARPLGDSRRRLAPVFVHLANTESSRSQRSRSRWIETAADRDIFGRSISAQPHDAPQLHGHAEPDIQLYAQLSSPRVTTPNSSSSPTAVRATTAHDRRGRLLGNPYFNYRSFRTTNVVRWEYPPGSTLFVVWQQGSEDVDNMAGSISAGTSPVCSARRRERLPGQVGVLVRFLQLQHPGCSPPTSQKEFARTRAVIPPPTALVAVVRPGCPIDSTLGVPKVGS